MGHPPLRRRHTGPTTAAKLTVPMTRPPPAVLVPVLLACVVSWSSWPRCAAVSATDAAAAAAEHPEPTFARRLALFEHVLHNDVSWSPVLDQRVKLTAFDLPQYGVTAANSATVDGMRLVARDAEEATAVDVLRNLMDKCPWSGTGVNYAAAVLGAAFTCFTYENVSFLLSQVGQIDVVAREEKQDGEKHNKLDDMLDDVRMTFVVFIDKMAAMYGDLNMLADGLYDYDSADEDESDIVQLHVLKLMKVEVDEMLAKHCNLAAQPPLESLVYLNRCNAPTGQGSGDPAAQATLDDKLANFNKTINCVIGFYDELNIQSMPMETWVRILEYSIPIGKKINFYTDATRVVRSVEGVKSERLKKAIALASEEETLEEKKQSKLEKKKKKKSKPKKKKSKA